MTYFDALLFVLLTTPEYWLERPDDTREPRMAQVAAALQAYAPEVAAAAIVQGQAESGFARYVAEGCRVIPRGAPSCDRGKARGYWQQWRAQCPGAYAYESGSPESLRAEVACVARRWRWHLSGAGRVAGFPPGRWALYRATLARLRSLHSGQSQRPPTSTR